MTCICKFFQTPNVSVVDMEMLERDGDRQMETRLSMRSVPLSPTPPPPYTVVPPVSAHSSVSSTNPSSSPTSQVGVNLFTGPNWEVVWRTNLEPFVNPQQMPFFDAASPGLAEIQNRENEGERMTISVVGPASVPFTPPVPSPFSPPSGSSSSSSHRLPLDRMAETPLPRMAQLIAATAMNAARHEVEEEGEARKLAWLIGCSEGTQTTPSISRRSLMTSTPSQTRPLSTISDDSVFFVDASEGSSEGSSSPKPSMESSRPLPDETSSSFVTAGEDLEQSPVRSTPRHHMLYFLPNKSPPKKNF
jgi:hypothetical protein